MSVTLERGAREAAPQAAGESRPYATLSVIVPVFNERNTVAEIIHQMQSVEIPLGLEIIIVDDASTDGTDQILDELAHSNVRVLRHPNNRGKGAAVRTGLAAVTGDLVLIQDADLEYDPADWPVLLEPVLSGKAKVVFGSRFSGDCQNMTRLHRFGNRFLSFATSLLYSAPVSDMNTCYKLFDCKVFDRVRIKAERFNFDPEITAKVLRHGYAIHEVPISYFGRGVPEGKKITWRDGGSMLITLLRYRLLSPDR
ncbi:MAG: glycosyltransferase family 2 protein [Candidatus Dormiibacterota bacterium]|jgi:glycosyltransferase involved in cell wall biosynthesis